MAEAAGVWRKGPWTPQEDRLLIEYITQNGEGRWSSVFKCTGLKRSGKSCRLRWVNYLRPGLKKGQLTPQEEGIIIELHALWGNKWSTIARYLPGRTDNEIKNYWRTHFKIKRPSNFKQQKTKTILDQQQESQTVIGSNGFDQEVAFLSMDDIDEMWSRVDEESGSPDLIPTDCYLWGGLWNLDGGDHCSSNIQEQANDVANYCHPFEGDAVDHYVQSGEFLF